MEIPQIENYPLLKRYLKKNSNPLTEKILHAIFISGQADNLFSSLESLPNPDEKLDSLIESLIPVERFYDVLGGLHAYHNEFLWLLEEKQIKKKQSKFLLPHFVDITQKDANVKAAIRTTIENLEIIGEIYPVGGAGDRFNLIDLETKHPLPVAALQFRGKSLLDGLIRDIQAKEFLCFKLRNVQVTIPVAMMTSTEKENHRKVTEMLESNAWHGRGKDRFRLFIQPQVPVISDTGMWIQKKPLELHMKPGGHGVIWKIAHDEGVFDWFDQLGVSKGLVRQINNPVAGTDYGLLAFIGIGIVKKKLFGFSSCERVVNSAEGMNALIENYFENAGLYEYAISNVEYVNLEQEGIEDIPCEPGSRYSAYPCNTNILFIDLPTIDRLSVLHPLPGLLINFKHTYTECLPDGTFRETKGGRIETTMQNISDYIVLETTHPIENQDLLNQYITFNDRKKTISVTKMQHTPGKEIENTPEGALRDLLSLHRTLLQEHCLFDLPQEESIEEYLHRGPSVYFDFHPALGPLYDLIGKKIRGGILHQGTELILEASELDLENLELDGSLIIHAHTPLGHHPIPEKIEYSHRGGKCTLKNVKVINSGIDREQTKNYWKGTPIRHEECRIELEGSGEFHAENVELRGNKTYRVPDGHRLTVTSQSEILEPISEPTWWWEYQFLEDNSIEIQKVLSRSTTENTYTQEPKMR